MRSRGTLATAAALLPLLLAAAPSPWDRVAARADADASAGRPLVAHVVVALCDNAHQGIVPVPAALGDGSDPARNLYWGAAYGVRTYLTRHAGWTLVRKDASPQPGVLERLLLRREVTRGGKSVPCVVVAEAWDGAEMAAAMTRFLTLASGGGVESLPLPAAAGGGTVSAGGAAHILAFVGHDGLMDAPLPSWPGPVPAAEPRACAVLACASRPFFGPPLERGGAHRTLLTTGLMAPEAYTLAAFLEGFFAGEAPTDLRARAAAAYHRYQRCGERAARRLFTGDP